ncbi:MAG TPA: cofactor-independent phosphoglycerate mutase [Clostridiales bacterium]|nr:cofactor-independent phosphoglycerate mutase [Clostridiales bacterium]
MKYIIVLGDGMADYPISQLGNKTPLQAANKPNMDNFARFGEVGLVSTIPPTLSPGSDVANLSVLGYDPVKYYTGRSPLEAISMGVPMAKDDVAFRTNLVTLSEAKNYMERIMLDHSCDEITTEESVPLIEEVNRHFKNDFLSFYKGVSYRHCLLWKNGSLDFELTPPHDIRDQKIAPYLPKGKNSDIILQMMQESTHFLSNHPINRERIRRGLNPANSIWIWGQGKKPLLPSFFDLHSLKGAVISAVDLVKGLGLSAGMESIDVEGATGTLDTNYAGKLEAALQALKDGKDFVYLHVEAPDECGHRGEVDNKVRAIELIDEKVISPLLEGLEQYYDYKLMVLPDHATPLSTKTHSSDPAPYVIFQKSRQQLTANTGYDEVSAKNSGIHQESGPALLSRFLKN